MFWSDHKDPKGFFIFDTETQDIEFIQNKNAMFHKIMYDDNDGPMDIDYLQFSETYVKIVVVNKQNPYLFDKMLDELYKVNPAHLAVIEDYGDDSFENIDSELIDQAEDTLTILSNYIDQQGVDVDSNKLKNLMRELYVEALAQETI